MKYSVAMPNKWNFAFHLPSAMRVYLLFLCLPGKGIHIFTEKSLIQICVRSNVLHDESHVQSQG